MMTAARCIAVSAALCLASCAWRGADGGAGASPETFIQSMGPSRYVAVLPFEGDDANPQLAAKIRQSFCSHFSPKKYHDVEPRDVDALLEAVDELSRKQWRGLSPVELGRYFKADYLIYGKVVRTRRLFFILYSQLALDVELRMVETRRGKTVWTTEIEKRLQSGEVPLHPLSLFSAAVRTGVDASDERMQDLIERTCRELADRVPEPAGEPAPAFRSDVQVSSFSSFERAQQELSRLKQKGYPARIEKVSINGVQWHRIIIGPYSREDAGRARQELASDPAARPALLDAR